MKLSRFHIAIFLIALVMLTVFWLFSNLLTYIIVSLVISSLIRPISDFISNIEYKRIRLPKYLGVLVAFAVLFLVIILFVSQFFPLISEEMKRISNIDYERLISVIDYPINKLNVLLSAYGFHFPDKETIMNIVNEYFINIAKSLNFKHILDRLIAFTGNFFVAFLSISFITAFLIYDRNVLRKPFMNIIPNQYFEISISAFNKIEKLLSRYVKGVFLQMLSIFILLALGLTVFDVRFAFTIALFAAVINIVPYVGPLIGVFFGIVVGLSTSELPLNSPEFFSLSVKILSVFSVVQFLDNILFQPLIFSKSVKAHPLEIFIVIFVAANLAGALGMVISIPLYTTVKVIFTEFYKGSKQYKIFQNV